MTLIIIIIVSSWQNLSCLTYILIFGINIGYYIILAFLPQVINADVNALL